MTKLHLHNEGISNISLQNGALHLTLKHFSEATQSYIPYNLTFYGVRHLKIMNEPTDQVIQPPGSGDILRYKEPNPGQAFLLTEWTDFANGRAQQTVLYEFDFAHYEIDKRPGTNPA